MATLTVTVFEHIEYQVEIEVPDDFDQTDDDAVREAFDEWSDDVTDTRPDGFDVTQRTVVAN